METISEEYSIPPRTVKVFEQKSLMGVSRRIYLHFFEGNTIVAKMPINSQQLEGHRWDGLVNRWESGQMSWNGIDTFVKQHQKQ